MSKYYEAPCEVRELEKFISNFVYYNGLDTNCVFDDFLRYIIHGFSPGAPPISDWTYSKEQNAQFYEMLRIWIRIMQEQLITKEWYDAFGDLYMLLIASNSRVKQNAQFFTPPEICDLMTQIVNPVGEKKNVVQDPTCGSGRLLLSAHILNSSNYYVAEDIDQTCCLMTVCNFLVHGLYGEVVWHDSLQPDTFWRGWLVNCHLAQKGIPTVHVIDKNQSYSWNYWEEHRKNIEKENINQ